VEPLDEVLEQARRLGEVLGRHERFRRLRQAEEAVRQDAEARQLSQELNEQMEKIADLEARMAPIEPEDKRRLQELRDKARLHPVLQELAHAQADYLEMMARVNETIQEQLGIEKPQLKQGPSLS